MVVDKTALSFESESDDHIVSSTWHEDPVGLFSLKVGTSRLLPDSSATVTAQAQAGDANTTTYTFSGGSVTIKDRTGKVREHVTLACPNKDIVKVTVTVLP